MSATTRLAAMTAAGLFVLTACGDDEPDQPTGTETQGGEEETTEDSGIFEASELQGYAEENYGHIVGCSEDLDSMVGSFVVCDIDESESSEDYEYVMFTVNPNGDFMMRELSATYDEPLHNPEPEEENTAGDDSDGETPPWSDDDEDDSPSW